MRAALLGCGQVSFYQLHAWAQIEGVEVVALYNRTIEKAQERARQFGIPPEHVYDNYQALLDHESLDFVDVATAPVNHRELVEAAAGHGLPVLCQKPFAPSLEDARAMISACQEAGVLFSINENWRWRPWYLDVKRLLDEKVIGQLRFARFTSHRNLTMTPPGGDPPLLLSKQPYTAEMDQLILFEWGTHLIDVTRFLFGEPQAVYARMTRASPHFRGEDRALVVLEYPAMSVLLDLSWATTGDEAAEQRGNAMLENFLVEGDQGLIEILPEPDNLFRLATRHKSWERPAYSQSQSDAYLSSYIAAQRHFFECLRDGRVPETVALDNLRTMEATQAAYDAAAQGQVILLHR